MIISPEWSPTSMLKQAELKIWMTAGLLQIALSDPFWNFIFFIELGLKLIQFKIKFKTKSEIFIQKNIHSIESGIFNRIIHSPKKQENYSKFQNMVSEPSWGPCVDNRPPEMDFGICANNQDGNCRSLTKVKFSTDQVRPALGSGSWLIDWSVDC